MLYLCIVNNKHKQQKQRIMKTIEEIYFANLERCETKAQVYNLSDSLVAEIIGSDARVLSCDRRHANGYSTWRISIFANNYHFGGELADILNSISIITHDEDRVFTPEDLREDIDLKVTEWLVENWEKNK